MSPFPTWQYPPVTGYALWKKGWIFLSVLPLGYFIGKDFVTWDDQDEFSVSIKTAEGKKSRPLL